MVVKSIGIGQRRQQRRGLELDLIRTRRQKNSFPPKKTEAMANFLTLLLALFAMTAFSESFCDRREGENEERERVADQRRAVFSVCMSFLDSFATCRRAGSRRQSACRRQPLSPFFFLSSPPSTLLHTHKQKNSRHPRRRLVQVSKEEFGALSLPSLIFSFPSRCPPPPVSLLQPHSKTTQPRKNLCLSFLQGLALRRRSRRRGRRRRHRRWRRNRLRRRQQPEQQLLQQ